MNSNFKDISGYLSLIFLISVVSLDISFGVKGLKIGNILLVLSCALTILVGLRLAATSPIELKFGVSDKYYLLLVFIVFASCAWSPEPKNVIFQAFVMIMLWGASLLLANVGLKQFLKQFINLAVLVAILSFLLIPLAPGIAFQPSPSGSMPELRGIFHHQLRFGLYMGLTLGFLLLIKLNSDRASFFKSEAGYYFTFFIILSALVLSFARLYSLFTLLSIVLVVLFSVKGARRYVALVFLMTIISLILIFEQNLVFWLQSIGIDTTLTGRVRIWVKTLELASDGGFWGYGFASFDSHMFDRLWGIYRPAHAHNSFIQAYFELGVVGLIILITLVVAHFKDVYSKRGSAFKFSYAGFVFFLTVLGSLTGANYASKPTLLFSVMLVLIALERGKGSLIGVGVKGQ